MKPRDLCLAMLLSALVVGPALGAPADVVCGSWNAVSLPDPTGRGLTDVSASSPSDIWAVWRGVYHWNGASWSAVPAPGLGSADTVFYGVAAVAPSQAWIVGYTAFLGTPQTLVERWDGAKWSMVPSPVITGGSEFDAVTVVSPNDVWAVGARAGGLPEFQATRATLTAHWNGSSWTAVPSPNVSNRTHELRDVAAISSNDVWAVGNSRNITELYKTLILHWNGSAWSVVPSPNFDGSENFLYGVSGTASNDVWAVGGAWDGITWRQIFLHWDGSSWTQVNGLGGPTACAGCGGDVLAMGPNDVWAVGSNIGHWNGTAWTLVPNPPVAGSTGMTLRGLARTGACDAWAVGGSFDTDGAEQALSVHLTAGDGTINIAPVAQASASPSTGFAPLEVHFSSAGTHDPDGSVVSYSWNFGDGANSNSSDPNPVHTYLQTGPLTYHVTLVVTDDKGAIAQANTTALITAPMYVESQSVSGAYVGKDEVIVSDAKDEPVIGAAVVAEYSGPASGVVNGTTGSDGKAILTTPSAADTTTAWCFKVISVTKSGYVYSTPVTQQCETAPVVSAGLRVPAALALRVTPNPWRGATTIGLALPRAGEVRVMVVDIAGRMVQELAFGFLAAGDHPLVWDGRDATGRAVGAGVYLITASAGEQRVTVRTLRMR